MVMGNHGGVAVEAEECSNVGVQSKMKKKGVPCKIFLYTFWSM
jgi:hypothetical protein